MARSPPLAVDQASHVSDKLPLERTARLDRGDLALENCRLIRGNITPSAFPL